MQQQGAKPRGHCHWLVKKVAQEAAGQLYEKLMGESEVWAEWKRQNPGLGPQALEARFVARWWGDCVPFARATLATMLRSPIDTATGEAIMEALTLDNTLLRGRAAPAEIIGTIH